MSIPMPDPADRPARAARKHVSYEAYEDTSPRPVQNATVKSFTSALRS